LASLRKKYQGRVEMPEAGPVTAPPPSETVAAPPPPAADAPKQMEPLEPVTETKPDPVSEAAQSAIKQRLAEVERAQSYHREAPPQEQFATEPEPQQPTPEQIIEHTLAQTNLPESMQNWLRQRPEYLFDLEKNSALQHFHWQASREAEQFSDGYYAALESKLGLANGGVPDEVPEPRKPAPQPQRQSVPVTAPVNREAPSMSTGRPRPSSVQLTGEERAFAKTLGLTDKQMLEGKEKMMREKAGGFHNEHG
jgi:hypothetical protein